jgi:diguanylate cyclase (GGDEF)-like protein/PAS domain S-box-containing protein
MIVKNSKIFDNTMVQSFLNTFENSIDSIVITSPSPEEHFLYVNEAFKHSTGYIESDLVGKSPRILQGEKTDRAVLDDLKDKLQKGKNFIGQNINYRKDGSTYIVKWYVSALRDEEGDTIAYVSYQKEITQSIFEHKQALFLASVVNQIKQMVVVTDLKGNIVYANDTFIHKTGYSKEFIIGNSMNFLRSGKHTKSFYANFWQTILQNKSYHGVFINKCKNGELYFAQKTISPMKDENGDIEFFISVGQDVTELIEQSDTYKQKAYHDTLTGLHNRLKFDECIQEKYKKFTIDSQIFSLILIDIDNFKEVNDTYGHDKGDKILKEVADALQTTLRKDDLIVRWGGEEFIVLIDNNIKFCKKIAEKIRIQVFNSVKIENYSISVSIGVSQIETGDTIESLFSKADKALYQSKKDGKNRVTYL